MWYYQNTKWLPSAEKVVTGDTCPPPMCVTHTYLAREIPWSRRRFTQGEAQPLHSGCADPCEFLKCGNLDCIIYGSGGLRPRSPLMSCVMTTCCLAPGFRMTWLNCPCLWRSLKSVVKDTLWTNWKVETFVCSKTLLTFCGNIMLRNAARYLCHAATSIKR